jgi:hypothetical protein
LFKGVHRFTHLALKLLDLVGLDYWLFLGLGCPELDDFIFGNCFVAFLI